MTSVSRTPPGFSDTTRPAVPHQHLDKHLPPTTSNPLFNIFLVAVGGAVGSVARYAIGLGAEASIGARFPAGTLIANLLGCFIIGGLLFLVMDRNQPSPQIRLLVMTGFLGGLTTFSSFGMETVRDLQTGHAVRALANVAANVLLGLGAVGLGYTFAKAAA